MDGLCRTWIGLEASGVLAFRGSLKKNPTPGARDRMARRPGPPAGHRHSGAAVGLEGRRRLKPVSARSKSAR